SQSTLENPSKTYTDAGAYSVTLTAVGAGGTNVRARANYIVVTNAPPPLQPVADFQADPTNGPAPLTVSFINLSQRATNYLWDFGDGSQSGPQSPSKTYTNAGVYTVTLTVLGAGGSDVRTRPNYIVVTNRPAGADRPSSVLNPTK